MVNSYCNAVKNLDKRDVNRLYHDFTYGFPLTDDNELFGRLIMEINQAGLSWTTILKKQENFRRAYAEFSIQKIANFTENDRNRLLNDAGIIRNRLKINAAIHNANMILELQKKFGSFKNWLDHNHPLDLEDWVKLFKKHFKFTGGEITKEFLLSTGYLEGAHARECPVYKKILKKSPGWATLMKKENL
ncbi:MAG: DNA-3-methyladenine glycosylase I [Fidelibacterota bacterium]